jgi:hypothetical protein
MKSWQECACCGGQHWRKTSLITASRWECWMDEGACEEAALPANAVI